MHAEFLFFGLWNWGGKGGGGGSGTPYNGLYREAAPIRGACFTLQGGDFTSNMQEGRVSHLGNRPFYSCVLSHLAMNASEAGGDLASIQTSQLFSCKCQLVSIRKA